MEQRPAQATPFDPNAVDLVQYVGVYGLPGDYAQVRVSTEAGQLCFAVAEGERVDEWIPLIPVGPHQFAVATDPSRTPVLVFDIDAEGRPHSVDFALFTFNRAL